MAFQTTATPLNGEEARRLIELTIKRILDQTPGLDVASAYHRITIRQTFEISAYPSDIPTPSKEIEFNVDSLSTKRGENEEHFAYLSRLETQRDELIATLEKITDVLDKANPVIKAEIPELHTLNQAGESEPDRLRIEQGLPIPVVTKESGRMVEGYVQVKKEKSGFFFGGGKKVGGNGR